MIGQTRTRFNFKEESGLAGRAYIFPSFSGETQEAIDHLQKIVEKKYFQIMTGVAKNLDYTHALLWVSSKGDKMIDFMGYSLDGDWKSNPTAYSWATKNGVIVHKKEVDEVSCGNGIVILGMEEFHRYTTNNLDEYLISPPLLNGISFTEEDLARRA